MDILAENSLFFMPLLVGSIFIITGFIMYKFPPKKINSLYGYRTTNSMKTQERWDFSQKYSSVLMLYCGLFLVLISFLGLFFELSKVKEVLMSMILIFLVIFAIIYKTETAIKQKFKNEK